MATCVFNHDNPARRDVCTCWPGYEGDGLQCFDPNQCAPNPCVSDGGIDTGTCGAAAGADIYDYVDPIVQQVVG
eukprot:SAG22_NODE_14830_length_364_cov_0.524528_1_plen_73_part_01